MRIDVVNDIVADIEHDILDRRGLKWELRQCTPDTRESIREAWREIVLRQLEKAGVDFS